jgi:hypothetical protein
MPGIWFPEVSEMLHPNGSGAADFGPIMPLSAVAGTGRLAGQPAVRFATGRAEFPADGRFSFIRVGCVVCCCQFAWRVSL